MLLYCTINAIMKKTVQVKALDNPHVGNPSQHSKTIGTYNSKSDASDISYYRRSTKFAMRPCMSIAASLPACKTSS
jgi:hypothetical protein